MITGELVQVWVAAFRVSPSPPPGPTRWKTRSMTSNDRFRELLLQHGDYLDRIEEAWRLADSTMLEWQMSGMKRHTGGYEKLATDERASIRKVVAEYNDRVVMPLLPLVDEMLQRELIAFADRLHQDIQDPRRPWSTRYRERRSKLDRLLYARSAKAHQTPDAGKRDTKAARRPKRSKADVFRDEGNIAAHLTQHPDAKRDEVAKETGIAPAHVSDSVAWKEHKKKQKEARKANRARAAGGVGDPSVDRYGGDEDDA